MPAAANEGTSALEAYGLTFETFDEENDVQILNADTTEISVSQAYSQSAISYIPLQFPFLFLAYFQRILYLCP